MKITYEPVKDKAGKVSSYRAIVDGLRVIEGEPEPIFALRFGDENAVGTLIAYKELVASDPAARADVIGRINGVIEKASIIQMGHHCIRPDCNPLVIKGEAKKAEVPASGDAKKPEPKPKKAKKKAGKKKS